MAILRPQLKRPDASYSGLNSHCPLQEWFKGDLCLSREQLEEVEAARQQRRKEKMAGYLKAYVERERAVDLEGFLARENQKQKDWSAANPGRQLALTQRSRDRARAESRYHCSVCNKDFMSPSALKKQFLTQGHLAKVANVAENGVVQTTCTIQRD